MQTYRLADIDQNVTGELSRAGLCVYTSLDECEAVWRQAATDCSCSLFQTYGWQSAWMRTVGALCNVSVQIIHLFDENDKTLLLIPLGIYRTRFMTSLQFLGGELTDYNAPLIAPSFATVCSRRDFIRLWSIVLNLLPKVDIVWLKRMPEVLDGTANIMQALPGAAHSLNAHSTFLPASFADFTATRNAHFFKQNRTLSKRIAGLGTVTFHLAEGTNNKIAILKILARQKSRWMRAAGHCDLFAEPGHMEFYEALMRTPWDRGEALLSSMQVGGQTVATQLSLVCRNRCYCLVLGREMGPWDKYSVGRLLMEWMVKHCIAKSGIEIFDLTIGDEAFKSRWTDRCLPLYESLAPKTVKGVCFAVYRGIRSGLRGSHYARRIARLLAASLRTTKRGDSFWKNARMWRRFN